MNTLVLSGPLQRPTARAAAAAANAARGAAPASADGHAAHPAHPTRAALRTLQPPDLGQRGAGLAVVVAVHVAAGVLLATGLAREAVRLVSKPLQMHIIPEQVVPPPPPPKLERKVVQRPRLQAPPPPAYVPPPEVAPLAPPPAPAIVAVQSTQPVPAPPPAPAPPPPAPPAPQVAVVKREIGLACPGYQGVLAQTLAEAYERVGINGAVRTRFSVRGSQVLDVTPLSGPKEYFKYVQAAVKRMRCAADGADEVQVTLDVSFTG